MICIKNAKVITPDGILENGCVLLDGDRITAVGTAAELSVPAHTQVVDAEGLYVGPGFVDIHVHGGGQWMFDTDPVDAAKHFLAHGETTVLPTLYYNLDKETFLAAIRAVQEAAKQVKNIAGFYMEGPYMNPKYGASAELNKWKGEIREEDYKSLVDAAGTDARIWAIAPEREGLEPFMAYAKAVNPNTAFAVGHSEATPAQCRALKKYGITIHTHCMNATGRIGESGGVRGLGPDEACLLDDEVYAELISDSLAIHVAPDMQKLVRKVKGADKIILISDSFVSPQPNPTKYAHVTDLSFDANGGLCGSKLTMDAAVRNYKKHTGCSIAEAFAAATANPARAVGLYHRVGSIEPGKQANLVFVDEDIHVKNVFLNGNPV